MAAPSGHRSRGSDDLGVFDDAKSYYTEERHQNRAGPRTRTYSQVGVTDFVMLSLELTSKTEQLDVPFRASQSSRAFSTRQPW
jgi:hypothetical protein